ncbi:MAG: GTP cyclohydrolase I FolE [Acidobacteria bacterium]|nr:GTP cyclohydrolase I FolE [Acidobacteriota bacterium]MCW5971168.1 GTP cyclohydrolase I FolE [Blastocatellales bacterium]
MSNNKIDREKIAEGVRLILEGMGEDPARSGIVETPERVAEMFAEVCGGLHEDPAAEVKVIPVDTQDEIVMVKDIPLFSLCEHHMLPFTGVVHIAYVPDEGRVIGLSKLARIADIYARRLQVQERLTTQIAELLYHGELNPKGVMVVIEAEHLCMIMRGVKKPGATTITSAVRGVFRSDERTRIEAMSFLTEGRRG